MPKSKKSDQLQTPPVENALLDAVGHLDQPDVWDIMDPGDQSFWEEFFKLEEVLETTDELDPPTFSITVQNHQTGEVKTFSQIHLKSVKKKIVC